MTIASHSSSKGRRPQPRKGEEAEGRPLRGEDDGPRPDGAATGRDDGLSVPFPVGPVPGRSLGPRAGATRRRAWSEEHSDEGASTAAARTPATRRQCQRLQEPRPKAAVMPGATFARAEGVPEDRKAPERARERRRRGPQGTPQVRVRAACPGLGRPREARSLRPRRLNIVGFDYVEGRAQRDPAGGRGAPAERSGAGHHSSGSDSAAPIGQRP